MTITWYGHSCFGIAQDGYTVLLDPYAPGSVPGLRLPRLTANEVLCTHDHRDHNAREQVRLQAGRSPFTVTAVPAFHDHHRGAHRGSITMYVLEANGLRVAHQGDLGCLLTAEQFAKLGRLDAVLIPVGGYYTLTPQEAKNTADMLGAPVTIPMHYRGNSFGYAELAPLDTYLSLCTDVRRYASNTIELTKGMPRQTAVLQLKK